VNEDLKSSNVIVEEDKRRIKKQRDFVETHVNAFEKTVQDSTQRVQDLLS
jgi:hypothetical protein